MKVMNNGIESTFKCDKFANVALTGTEPEKKTPLNLKDVNSRR